MLELKQISKRFGDKQILSDFNLLVPENKLSPLLVLLGRKDYFASHASWS